MFLQAGLAQRHHLFRRRHLREQRLGRLVDADIGRLRRQDDGDQQGILVDMVQLALRGRPLRLEAAIHLDDIGFLHAFDLTMKRRPAYV